MVKLIEVKDEPKYVVEFTQTELRDLKLWVGQHTVNDRVCRKVTAWERVSDERPMIPAPVRRETTERTYSETEMWFACFCGYCLSLVVTCLALAV